MQDNGWGIPPADVQDPERRDTIEAQLFLAALEEEVLPQYYARDEAGVPRAWVRSSKHAMMTVIPQFILMRTVGWVDTPWSMIVPGLFGSAFGTYLMRQFFRTLPTDLEEAAILDGCSPWQIYWRILLPHAKPAVTVLAVLTWVNVWNDFLWPLLMIQRNSLATLTLGLVRMRGEYVARWPVIMATSILIMVPLVIIYAIAQRSFVRGIAMSGLGG